MHSLWPTGYTVVSTPKRNYTTSEADYQAFFQDMGYADGYAQYKVCL